MGHLGKKKWAAETLRERKKENRLENKDASHPVLTGRCDSRVNTVNAVTIRTEICPPELAITLARAVLNKFLWVERLIKCR